MRWGKVNWQKLFHKMKIFAMAFGIFISNKFMEFYNKLIQQFQVNFEIYTGYFVSLLSSSGARNFYNEIFEFFGWIFGVFWPFVKKLVYNIAIKSIKTINQQQQKSYNWKIPSQQPQSIENAIIKKFIKWKKWKQKIKLNE